MTKDEVSKIFQIALENGKKGILQNYSLWLSEQGIIAERCSAEIITHHLIKQSCEFPSRKRLIERIANLLGYFLRDKQKFFHIPVIGASGMGKTHLLRTLITLIKENSREFILFGNESGMAGVEDFYSRCYDGEDIFQEEFLAEIDPSVNLLIIDSFNYDCYIDILNHVKKKIQKGVLITAWTPELWFYYKNYVEQFLPTTEEIILKPLNEGETQQIILLISKFLNFYGTKEVMDLIFSLCQGIPNLIIPLLLESLNQQFNLKKKSLDFDCMAAAAKKLLLTHSEVKDNLQAIVESTGMSQNEIEQRIKEGKLELGFRDDNTGFLLESIKLGADLNPIRKLMESKERRRILNYLCMGPLSVTQLAQIMNVARTTLSYHIKILTQMGIISQIGDSRRSPIFVDEKIKPFVQLELERGKIFEKYDGKVPMYAEELD